jgi:hypothetical protein
MLLASTPLFFAHVIDPDDGSVNPAMILSSVDFPHPDGPTIVIHSPVVTEREIGPKAWIDPERPV